jgi:Zn-dependent protease
MNRLGIEPTLLTFRIVTLLISFSFHEFSHAFMADKFCDPTPRQDGRLTLNPVRHLDIVGSIMLIVTGFGWASLSELIPAISRESQKQD